MKLFWLIGVVSALQHSQNEYGLLPKGSPTHHQIGNPDQMILGDSEHEFDTMQADATALSPAARLIDFGNGTRLTMHTEQVHEMLQDEVRFVDVTNHPELPLFPPSTLKTESESSKTTFPSKTRYGKLVAELQSHINRLNLFNNLVEFSSFWTRYCNSDLGLESSLWLHDLVQNITSSRDDISVHTVDHEGWKQKSVITRIEGTDFPDEVVILGAHLDSINLGDYVNGRAPGADDNGSGSVTLVEALRIITESDFKPRNSLEFHWYSAEEIGLLGSLDVFADYAARNVSVRAMLEQDMTGASNRYRGEVGDEIRLVTDNVDPELTDFLKLLVIDHTDVGYSLFACGYACSDFYSGHIHNYPSAFANERANEAVSYPGFPRIGHNELDTIDRIDFVHMTQHVKLALGYLVELGLTEFV